MTLSVTDVQFARGGERDIERGLLGYLSITLDDELRLDGLTLRRTRSNRLAVSFPRRRGGVHPIGVQVRVEIEAQVFQALGLTESP